MKALYVLAIGLFAASASAQQVGVDATSGAKSDSGAFASTGSITFEAAEQHKRSSVSTVPNVYAPPAMFGGANNCGQSSTFGVGVLGGGASAAIASESDSCNDREDTSISYKLGYKEVADLRFFCFGGDKNRMAYEAAGHKCPATATAKGLEDQRQARATASQNSIYSGGQ